MKKVEGKTLLEWRIIYHAPDGEKTEQEKRIAWAVISNWTK